MNEKELKINKRLKVGIITFSILTVIMLIGNKSYAIFQKSVKTEKPIITINTSDEFPPKGPVASGLAKYLIDKAYTSDSELVAIDVSDKSNVKKCASVEACKGKEIEYRYIGPNVNNYLYLKDNNEANETWRIIGVFSNDDNTEWNVKVVRDEVLPDSYLPTSYVINNATINGETKKVTYTIKWINKNTPCRAYWNVNDSGTELNRWEESGLQYYLNTEQDSGSNKGYLNYLSADTKELLVEKTYTLGTVKTYPYPIATPKEAYDHERDVESCVAGKGPNSNNSESAVVASNGCKVWSGNAAKWKGKIGLMYPSDYGLSATEDKWTTSFYEGSGATGFVDKATNSKTWMYSTMADSKSKPSWLLSPSSEGDFGVTGWYMTGDVDGELAYVTATLGVRPVLYLSSAASRISGEGTSKSDGYVILK